MSALLARNWWAVALRGVFSLICGVMAFLVPGIAITSLFIVLGAYLVVDGLFAIIAAVRAGRRHERWGLLVFEGIVGMAAGILAMTMPVKAIVLLVRILGAWAILTGVFMMMAAFRLHLTHGQWLMAFGGLASAIWGILLLIGPPLIGALVLTYWLGAYALIFGVTLLVLAFRLRQHRNDPVAPSDAIPQAA
ncbi:MAG: HdeD family acid-resistance protein [Alphaproteobacteria bacterium]|nr:HdeD family acid-resistance protein [Alphaproteobacteria bacterium]